MKIYKCPKCGRFYQEEIICPYCMDAICRDASSQSVIDRQAERIKELKAQLEQHRWIPVSERLPENVADVFILTDEGAGGIGFYGEDENGYGWERLDYAINLNITHWKTIIKDK